MDTFLNANNFRNKDLREWNPKKKMIITSCSSLFLRFHSLKSLFFELFAFKKRPSRRVGHIGHKVKVVEVQEGEEGGGTYGADSEGLSVDGSLADGCLLEEDAEGHLKHFSSTLGHGGGRG